MNNIQYSLGFSAWELKRKAPKSKTLSTKRHFFLGHLPIPKASLIKRLNSFPEHMTGFNSWNIYDQERPASPRTDAAMAYSYLGGERKLDKTIRISNMIYNRSELKKFT